VTLSRLIATALLPPLAACCPTGTTVGSRAMRPAQSSTQAGLTRSEAERQCAAEARGVLEMWRDQCRNPDLPEDRIRARSTRFSARYSRLLSRQDMATDCPAILAGRGGFSDFARARGETLAGYCLDKLGFESRSVAVRQCRQIGF
jgi:hypothetical protein